MAIARSSPPLWRKTHRLVPTSTVMSALSPPYGINSMLQPPAVSQGHFASASASSFGRWRYAAFLLLLSLILVSSAVLAQDATPPAPSYELAKQATVFLMQTYASG